MEIRLNKKTLTEVLALLERVIPTRSPNPLYTHLSLAVRQEGLVLTGTNGEVDLRVLLDAPSSLAEESGAHVLVPAAPLIQVVRSLGAKEEEITLAFDGTLSLKAGSFGTQLTVAEPEGYPELALPEPQATLKAQDLLKALTHVRYAASTEEYRAIFRGIQLEFTRGLRAVASDGYRLAIYEIKLSTPFPLDHPVKLVVPARSVDEVIRALKLASQEDEITLGFNVAPSGLTTDRVFSLSLSPSGKPYTVKMALRLMEGEFPDYERVIPKEFVMSMEAEADALKESLKRVSVLADRQNHRVDLFFAEGRLILSAEGDYGKGKEELPVKTSGGAITVSFNARYLLDALAPLAASPQGEHRAGTVRIALSGVHTPAVISDGSQPFELEGGYLAVVVPLRV